MDIEMPRRLARANSDPALAQLGSKRSSWDGNSHHTPGDSMDRERARDDSHAHASGHGTYHSHGPYHGNHHHSHAAAHHHHLVPGSAPARPTRSYMGGGSMAMAMANGSSPAMFPSWFDIAGGSNKYNALGGGDAHHHHHHHPEEVDTRERPGEHVSHSVNSMTPVATGPPVGVYIFYYLLIAGYLVFILGTLGLQVQLARALPATSVTLLSCGTAVAVVLTVLFTQIVIPGFFRDLFAVDEAGNSIDVGKAPCPKCGSQLKMYSGGHGGPGAGGRRGTVLDMSPHSPHH